MTHTIPITPKDDTTLKKRIFEHSFLPGMCGMSAEEFKTFSADYRTLSTSVGSVFFQDMYRSLAREHMADVVVTFAETMPDIEPCTVMESSDGYLYYPVDEKAFRLTFIHGVLCKFGQAAGNRLYMQVSDIQPDVIAVTAGTSFNNLLVAFQVKNAWDTYKNFTFIPENVQPRHHSIFQHM